MYQIHAEYLGSAGLTSHVMPRVYASREEAAKEALLLNCKAFTPYYFSVIEKSLTFAQRCTLSK